MKRRAFVLLAATAPWWVRRAFADSSVLPVALPGMPREAIERLRRSGRSLLVLIIPTDDAQKLERGRAFGEWLNHGSDAELAPLADATVVCAFAAELPEAFEREPLMAWLPARGPARALDGELPGYRDDDADEEEIFRRRVALLSGLARDALGPAAAARAAQARARYVKIPPKGSHWANASGCGTRVEDTPEEIAAEQRRVAAEARAGVFHSRHVMVIGCGMGHVPAKSSRFLYFFSRREE